jgi:hypothetical protein
MAYKKFIFEEDDFPATLYARGIEYIGGTATSKHYAIAVHRPRRFTAAISVDEQPPQVAKEYGCASAVALSIDFIEIDARLQEMEKDGFAHTILKANGLLDKVKYPRDLSPSS